MTTTTQADRERELLPCPFCGSSQIEGPKPEYIERAAGYGYTVYNVGHTNLSSDGKKCIAWVTAETKEEAIARWNRRSQPSSHPAGWEELRALAQTATPGPWEYDAPENMILDRALKLVAQPRSTELGIEPRNANGEYIAAANPATILALLDALAAAPPLPVQAAKKGLRDEDGKPLLAEIRKDAKRYRFLRDHGVPGDDGYPDDALLVYKGFGESSLLPEELDAAVDAARAAISQGDGE